MTMQQEFAFQPSGAQGTTPTCQATISLTNAVQQITLPVTSRDDNTMRITIDSTANAAWSYGASSGLTLGNGCFMRTLETGVFTLPPGVTQLSVIGSATNGNFRVTVGRGR
jgi:hypothetical protein